MENVFYISQFYPIIEDTLLNNLVRFYDNYEKQSVELALKITHMDQWMEVDENRSGRYHQTGRFYGK